MLNQGVKKFVQPVQKSIIGGVKCIVLCDHFFNHLELCKMGGGDVMYVLANDLPFGQHTFSEFSYMACSDGLYMDAAGAKRWSHGHRSFPGSETRVWADEWIWMRAMGEDVHWWPLAYVLSCIGSQRLSHWFGANSVVASKALEGDRLFWDPHIRRYAYTFQRFMEMPMIGAAEREKHIGEVPKLACFRAYPYVQPFDEYDYNLSEYSHNPARLSARIAGITVDLKSALSDGIVLRVKAMLKAYYQTKHYSAPWVPFFESCSENGEANGPAAWEASKKIRMLEQKEMLWLDWDVKHLFWVHFRYYLGLFNHVVWVTGLVKKGWDLSRTTSDMISSFFRPAPGNHAGRNPINGTVLQGAVGALPGTGGPGGVPSCRRQFGGPGGGQASRVLPGRPGGALRPVRPGSDDDSGGTSDDGDDGAGVAPAGGARANRVQVQPDDTAQGDGGAVVSDGAGGKAWTGNEHNEVYDLVVNGPGFSRNMLTGPGNRDLVSYIRSQLQRRRNKGVSRDTAISQVVEEISRKFTRKVPVRSHQRQRDKVKQRVSPVHEGRGDKQQQTRRPKEHSSNAPSTARSSRSSGVPRGDGRGAGSIPRKGDESAGKGSASKPIDDQQEGNSRGGTVQQRNARYDSEQHKRAPRPWADLSDSE